MPARLAVGCRPRPSIPVSVSLAVLVPCVVALVFSAPVHAGSTDDPEVTDPLGDAGPVPTPLAYDWGDITAVWFAMGEGSVAMTIEVAALGDDPPGEVGAHFRVGEAWWLAGWTTVVFPAPPFSYAGGFFCRAEADGTVPDASACDSVDARIEGDRFLVTLPLATFGLAPGGAIEDPRGYAVDVVSAQPDVQAGWVEVTQPGRAFPIPADAAPGASPSPSITMTPDGTGAAPPGDGSPPDGEGGRTGRGRDAPSLPPLALLGGVAAALVLARRGRVT